MIKDFQELKLQVKNNMTIYDVLSWYGVSLNRYGKGRCVLHGSAGNECFYVNPKIQRYTCYSCGRTGDAISFIQEMEGTDFIGAVYIAGVNLGLDAISLLPALKAVKIGKIAKTVLKTIPRLFGYAQAVNLITSEDAEALGKTFAKLGSGNLDQLNTQDFTNITQAIRIATMIGRDTKGTYRKAKSKIGSKTGEVEIKGTVGDQEVVTKVKREDVTSKKLGYKYIDDTKVKQKLVAEANSNSKYTKPQVQETDADGKKLTNEDGTPKMKTSNYEVKDVKNIDRTVLRDHTFDQQVGHPKALFEGWFGYKGCQFFHFSLG